MVERIASEPRAAVPALGRGGDAACGRVVTGAGLLAAPARVKLDAAGDLRLYGGCAP
jgi:hypothetical protein